MASEMDPSYYANLPAGAPPSGVVPNFDHPESRAIDAHIGMGVCIGITLVFVVMRLYVKLAITHIWGWDDFACILGFALIIAHDILAFIMMQPGRALGKHIWDLRITSIAKGYLQRSLATINLYAASAFFVKLSLFLLYLRLFRPNKVTRWLIYGGIFVCGLFYSASIISNCVLCMPQSGNPDNATAWMSRAQECTTPFVHLALIQGVFGTLSDIYLLVIPIRSIYQLHMPKSRKLGVGAIFMTGLVAVACSLGSIPYRAKLLFTNDTSWLGLSVYIFSAAEMSAGIICSCMPIIAALFRRHPPARFRLPSFRYFPLHFSSQGSSSRPFVSDKTCPADNLHAGERQNSLEQGSNVFMEPQSGKVFVMTNENV